MAVTALRRVSLTTAVPERLTAFYREALGFSQGDTARRDALAYGVAGGMTATTLTLGAQEIELVAFDRHGAPYPSASTSHDRWFQHMAIVAPDMGDAFVRLQATSGWTPITRGSPVLLPQRAGGVTAFKFRDPEGHPLELLHFPQSGRGPGIDHSAIAVADAEASIAFYAKLGLACTGRGINHGGEQDRLDDVSGAHVDVVALSPPQPTPHVELLGYRAPGIRQGDVPADNDVACARLVFSTDGAKTMRMRDPDGHALMLV